jgi:molecular chaperone Hsp33
MHRVRAPIDLQRSATADEGVRRFVFEPEPIRGHFVRLETAWRALREHREYPAPVRGLLGEAASASVLLAATLKFQGTLTLQLTGDGAVRLLVAQCTHDFRLRALARFDEERLADAREESGERTALETEMFRRLVGQCGRLVVTVEATDRDARYQGIVPLAGGSLAQALEAYFASSEQIPTRVRLAADERHAVGLLVQRLPGASQPPDDAQAQAAWRYAERGLAQIGGDELISQPLEQVLVRHFAEHDVRVFAGSAVRFECRCNPARVVRVLRALGADEVRSVLAEQGSVTVTCDFCDRPYRFDAIDVEQLLAAGAAAQAPPSVQ